MIHTCDKIDVILNKIIKTNKKNLSVIITLDTRILNMTIRCHGDDEMLFVNNFSMQYYCTGCIGHDQCRKFTVRPLHA